MEDFEKIDEAYKLLNSVNNPATRLWRIAWGIAHRQVMSFFDIGKTQEFIDKYGYDAVRFAFEESAMQNVFTLSYVRKVLENKEQQESVKKEKAFQALKMKEVSEISGDPVRPKKDMQPMWKKGMFDDILKK